MSGALAFGDRVLLTVSVRNAAKYLVPVTFIRLPSEWVKSNACLALLARLLREHGEATLADRLSDCEIVLKCTRSVGVHNSFTSKRARGNEEIIATTFLPDSVAETLLATGSDELHFAVSPPPEPVRETRDATELLMRAASSRNLALPPRKSFSRMTGEHNLYSAVVDYLEQQGMGWTVTQLPSGKLFLDHVTKAFWVLTPKVLPLPPPPPKVAPPPPCLIFLPSPQTYLSPGPHSYSICAAANCRRYGTTSTTGTMAA